MAGTCETHSDLRARLRLANEIETLHYPDKDNSSFPDEFGEHLLVVGNKVIVGAEGADFFGNSDAGAAYVFKLVPEPGGVTLVACMLLARGWWFRSRTQGQPH